MKRWPLRLVLCLLLVGLSISCHWHEEGDRSCDLIVINDSHCDLKVFVDGWDAGLVREGAVRTVDDIGSGRHVLEAVDHLGHVVERRYIDLARGENYYWRLESC
jgi:hypothetical protein